MKKDLIRYGFILILLFGIAVFVYPTLYKYDKLDQKYPVKINRITGETKVLVGSTWNTVSDSTNDIQEIEEFKSEIYEQIEQNKENIKNEVVESIRSEVLQQVESDLQAVQQEIAIYKESSLDPNNSFTINDTTDTVKKIMGAPDSINSIGPFDTWSYGEDSVKFEDGKVVGWVNSSNSLKIK
ncbi:hypothetical protein [Paenibacillus herberti]|uniref:hypothetical protein n=1 Tax=Paenibacillus herberti TaxID=1619309 RepID=UPI00113214F3|nr:hypothetical protein [Paenibacillus herberti]